jgi:hypothetical protein
MYLTSRKGRKGREEEVEDLPQWRRGAEKRGNAKGGRLKAEG